MPVEMERPFSEPHGGGAGEDELFEVDQTAHTKLIDSINNLTGSHFIREVTRTEPSLKRSEFGLVKSKTDKVRLTDLGKFFKKTPKQIKVRKQLEQLKKRNPLSKPLEQPVTDRLRREEGFKKAQHQLGKWEPMVQATAIAPQITFPLQYGTMAIHSEPPKKLSEYRVKTKLMEEMEALEREYAPADEVEALEGESPKYALTLKEMRQQLQERARLKRFESYQIAKGRRQNKIKSKKFHRLLKKDKLKEQMKRFEELKETDPEQALRQLDQIEKQRFEERATLRHKNTGTWAKNLQVRAKYNLDVRRELAEQLAIGKELTSKRLQETGSSSEEEGEEMETVVDGDNPWTAEREMGEHERLASQREKLASSYRRYWEERNRVEALKKQLAAHEENGTTNGTIIEVAEDQDRSSEDEIKPMKKGASFI